MAILAGIDEAGFGPLLGPLVVSGTVFRVPDRHIDGCLWDRLRTSCTASRERGDDRIVVTDSKRLFRSRNGLASLERTVLVMLAVARREPQSWRTLLESVAPGAGAKLDGYPWYAGRDITLPLSGDVGDLATQANAVRRDCEAQDVRFLGVFSEPVPVGCYNRLVNATRNKAVVLLGLVLRVMDRIMRVSPEEHLRLCVDHLGGRIHYREPLTTLLPGYGLTILEESPHRSAYRLTAPSQTGTRICDVEFVTGGEDQHFPVALASLYSKYLRELYMHVLNRYWSGRIAGLRATAGYYTDARRWLQEVSTELKRCHVDRSLLIRQR